MKPYYAQLKMGTPMPPSVAARMYTPPKLTPLDAAALAAFQSLPLRARMLVEAGGLGFHRSARRGSDVEFADYRDYQPGDDLKRVDWRLFARTDRLYVRRSHSETPLHVVLLLDTSRSMAYTGNAKRLSKIDFARAALGALALLARRHHDACGAGLLAESLTRWLAPSASLARMDAIWALLDRPDLAPSTELPRALNEVLNVVPSRSLIVVASDFYVEPAELDPVLKRLKGERHELIALRVLDPLEVDFAFPQPGAFLDIETGHRVEADPAAARGGYVAAFNAHAAALESTIAIHGGESVLLRTDTLPIDGLRAYLNRRARRR